MTRAPIVIGESTLPVPTRSALQAMLEGFGRPKDKERARLLR